MKQYYINTLHYTNSELKAADKFIPPYLRQLTHIVVSRRWAEGALRWTQAKLEEFYKDNPRASKLEATLAWPGNIDIRLNYSYPALRIGHITITLIPVVAEFDFFEVPMFPPEND